MAAPPLPALRTFEVAARHLSFTRAAAELHVTQGAVSQQIKQLEANLGFPLFHRGPRGLTLTEKGEALAATAESAFRRLFDKVEELRQTEPGGILTVSVSPSLAVKWLILRPKVICATTLRDGAQTQGVDFTVPTRSAIARELDRSASTTSRAAGPAPTHRRRLLRRPAALRTSRFVAFGMTRRPGRSAENDPGLQKALLQNTDADAVCMVGKTWDFHVDGGARIPVDENVA
jgi:predicted transcriptional regulator